jgi:four helix bundle protein
MPAPPSLSGTRRAELLQTRLVEFAAQCCRLFRGEYRDFERSHVAKQLVRSSTAPAAAYAEARHAESKRDFVHKLRVCLKELRETAVWLRLAAKRDPHRNLGALNRECGELIAIFVASVKTAETNLQRPQRER